MAQKKLKIHSENILPIIKRWLYSDKDIFIRELVSNATDAIFKYKKITGDQSEGRIDIQIDKEKGILTFSDDGIGMDAEEVEKYIAQIAFSGAEEFLKKYESKSEDDRIIGHFGLGFYSAYMVASKVEIDTLSHKPESKAVFWSCDGSSEYTIEEGKRTKRGTDVILTLSSEESEFLESNRLREILLHYCQFLPYPIYLNGSRINDKAPLWLKNPADCVEKEYLDFYRQCFPMQPDPIFWIHLNIDYPFNLKGILYFPKISQEGDFKKDSIKLYCNRVFVSDHCKDLLPDFLTILQGAIDSVDIPLNVSRSMLQMDRTVRQLASHISKKITDRLSHLYKLEKERFISSWEDIEPVVKFGSLQDEKFYEKAKEFLIWKSSHGEWTTLEEYLERSESKIVYYAHEEGHFFDLYKEKGIEVVMMRNTMLDHALIPFLEKVTNSQFKRIDSSAPEKILDVAKEKTVLDQEGKTESSKLAAFFQKKLESVNLEVEAKSLANPTVAGFLMIKEEERRLRDSLAFRNRELSNSFIKPTFIINTNSKLINAIHAVEKIDSELSKKMVAQVYDLARLSQKEMEPNSISAFVTRSTEILEELMAKLENQI